MTIRSQTVRSVRRKRSTSYDVFAKEALPFLDEIFRSARAMLGGRDEEAKDLVQEVFAQAWTSFDAFEAGTNCRAWLYAILTNKVRHAHRRKGRARVIPLSEHVDDRADEQLPADPVVPTELEDDTLLAALDRLGEESRETILLVDTRGFTYQEAAEILDVPIGTVMSRLARARTRLRRELAGAAAELGIETDGKSNR